MATVKDFFNSHRGLQLNQQVFSVMGTLCNAVTASVDGGECNSKKKDSRRIAWRIFVVESNVLDPSS